MTLFGRIRIDYE